MNTQYKKSMRVSTFTQERVPRECQSILYDLMKKWDGTDTVGLAFYSMDVLEMKLEEALQAYEQR